MEKGFVKAASDNLPKIDGGMVAEFFATNPNIFSAEVRNIKATRATKEVYGDNAIGYVQLKNEANCCVVKAKITPEHRIHKTSYNAEALIDVVDERVLSCECKDCAASSGGCKHAIAFLLWLHRRSEEPSVTSVTCYWKKSALADVGKSDMDLASVFGKEIPPLKPREAIFVNQLLEKVPNASGGVFDILRTKEFDELSTFKSMIIFKQNSPEEDINCENYLNYLKENMTASACKAIEEATRSQSECPLWFEMRFGRITASKLYEAAKCKTISGSLTEAILGGGKLPETRALERGRLLESSVIKEVAKIRKLDIKKCGLFLDKKYPMFGASPDGITSEYCVEIKCPISEKTVKNYAANGEIKQKYKCQIALQMLFSGRKKGLFCIASPEFETTKSVEILEITLDEEEILNIMSDAEKYWKTAIFVNLLKM